MGDRSVKALTFGLLALIAVAAGFAVGVMQRPPQEAVVPAVGEASPSPSPEGTPVLEVHVAGWVVSPGVVVVADGSIVADAIDAVGGLRHGARVDMINLASPVAAGDQIVVPGPGENGGTAGDGMPTGAGDGLVSLNRATAADLEALPGVGPVLAERIISHREARGGFDRVEDLLEVPGIGEAKLASITDLVRP